MLVAAPSPSPGRGTSLVPGSLVTGCVLKNRHPREAGVIEVVVDRECVMYQKLSCGYDPVPAKGSESSRGLRLSTMACRMAASLGDAT